ncbi:MAG: DsbA family oxidoreductase [Gemmatimonadota bacterium]
MAPSSSSDPNPTPPAAEVRLHQDYVDPASYLVHSILRRMEAEVEPRALELRPPPDPLIDAGDREWSRYLAEMAERAEELGIPFRPPRLVPWTRKAHELALHAREKGCVAEMDRRIYDTYFAEGRDIGRLDVLVEVAISVGLDATETKAALDVDRHAARLDQERRNALGAGVRGVPTLVLGDRTLEGFHREEEIRTFLHPTNTE